MKRNRIKAAVIGLAEQYDRETTQPTAKAAVDGLMWAKPEAVEQACAAAAVLGSWTRDKTLLRFVSEHLPDDAAERRPMTDEGHLTEAEHRKNVEAVVADYREKVKRRPNCEIWRRGLDGAERELKRIGGQG